MSEFKKNFSEFTKTLAASREKYLADAILEMVLRGILVVEQRQPIHHMETEVKSDGSTVVNYSENIRLVCRDFEYMHGLEEKLKVAVEALTGLKNDMEFILSSDSKNDFQEGEEGVARTYLKDVQNALAKIRGEK